MNTIVNPSVGQRCNPRFDPKSTEIYRFLDDSFFAVGGQIRWISIKVVGKGSGGVRFPHIVGEYIEVIDRSRSTFFIKISNFEGKLHRISLDGNYLLPVEIVTAADARLYILHNANWGRIIYNSDDLWEIIV